LKTCFVERNKDCGNRNNQRDSAAFFRLLFSTYILAALLELRKTILLCGSVDPADFCLPDPIQFTNQGKKLWPRHESSRK
jgi:hypothetical protein